MEVGGELWEEKNFDAKLLLVTPAIAWSQECTTQGHIKRGLIRKRVDSQYSDIS
jgi:hypothetical protein